jgi:hypothetical protein
MPRAINNVQAVAAGSPRHVHHLPHGLSAALCICPSTGCALLPGIPGVIRCSSEHSVAAPRPCDVTSSWQHAVTQHCAAAIMTQALDLSAALPLPASITAGQPAAFQQPQKAQPEYSQPPAWLSLSTADSTFITIMLGQYLIRSTTRNEIEAHILTSHLMYSLLVQLAHAPPPQPRSHTLPESNNGHSPNHLYHSTLLETQHRQQQPHHWPPPAPGSCARLWAMHPQSRTLPAWELRCCCCRHQRPPSAALLAAPLPPRAQLSQEAS